MLPHFTYIAHLDPRATKAMSPAEVIVHLLWWTKRAEVSDG